MASALWNPFGAFSLSERDWGDIHDNGLCVMREQGGEAAPKGKKKAKKKAKAKAKAVEDAPKVEEEKPEKPASGGWFASLFGGGKKAEEKPAEEKPAEEKPEEKPAEEKPAEEKPKEEKPSEEKPVEEKPASEEKPSEEKPPEAQSEAAKPTEAPDLEPSEKPAEAEPAPAADGEEEVPEEFKKGAKLSLSAVLMAKRRSRLISRKVKTVEMEAPEEEMPDLVPWEERVLKMKPGDDEASSEEEEIDERAKQQKIDEMKGAREELEVEVKKLRTEEAKKRREMGISAPTATSAAAEEAAPEPEETAPPEPEETAEEEKKEEAPGEEDPMLADSAPAEGEKPAEEPKDEKPEEKPKEEEKPAEKPKEAAAAPGEATQNLEEEEEEEKDALQADYKRKVLAYASQWKEANIKGFGGGDKGVTKYQDMLQSGSKRWNDPATRTLKHVGEYYTQREKEGEGLLPADLARFRERAWRMQNDMYETQEDEEDFLARKPAHVAGDRFTDFLLSHGVHRVQFHVNWTQSNGIYGVEFQRIREGNKPQTAATWKPNTGWNFEEAVLKLMSPGLTKVNCEMHMAQ